MVGLRDVDGPAIVRNLFSRPATRRYPYEIRHRSAGARGLIEIDIETCIFCSACGAVRRPPSRSRARTRSGTSTGCVLHLQRVRRGLPQEVPHDVARVQARPHPGRSRTQRRAAGPRRVAQGRRAGSGGGSLARRPGRLGRPGRGQGGDPGRLASTAGSSHSPKSTGQARHLSDVLVFWKRRWIMSIPKSAIRLAGLDAARNVARTLNEQAGPWSRSSPMLK